MEEFSDHIPNKTIPFVFIDSKSQDVEFLNDFYAQRKFHDNVQVLLDFANVGQEFKLRTIDDMADENYRLMKEVQQLNMSLIGEFINIVVWTNLSIRFCLSCLLKFKKSHPYILDCTNVVTEIKSNTTVLEGHLQDRNSELASCKQIKKDIRSELREQTNTSKKLQKQLFEKTRLARELTGELNRVKQDKKNLQAAVKEKEELIEKAITRFCDLMIHSGFTPEEMRTKVSLFGAIPGNELMTAYSLSKIHEIQAFHKKHCK